MGGEDNPWSANLQSSYFLHPGTTGYVMNRSDSQMSGDNTSGSPPKSRSFTPRRCQNPGCSNTQLFTRNSTYRKHMDKHVRPYKCFETNCKTPDFASAGDLKRHQHSIHGKHTFTCSILSCKRNRLGFARRDNLAEHMKRVHKADHSPSPQQFDEMSFPSGSMDETTSDNHSPDPQAQSQDTPVPITIDKALLVATLEELHVRRAMLEKRKIECDEQIAAMEKVLTIN
ncbi:hypothetical protein BGZ60DRAFT_215291 [Tricladium varicosporioides]|nr:hypothetical protein BGZ60DRAFT_215291 [Hymenoscyphus varicosporioides]